MGAKDKYGINSVRRDLPDPVSPDLCMVYGRIMTNLKLREVHVRNTETGTVYAATVLTHNFDPRKYFFIPNVPVGKYALSKVLAFTEQYGNKVQYLKLTFEGGAALICAMYVNADTGTGIYTDWYLPSSRATTPPAARSRRAGTRRWTPPGRPTAVI
jgi:hypothetical protein